MQTRIKLLTTLTFLSLWTPLVYSQKADTTFYGNGNRNIRSIEINNEGNKILTVFKSETGENLLTQKTFNYLYFDSLMTAKRIVEVENYIITREYWINEHDTIFNIAKFDESFNQQIHSFINYMQRKLVYPKEAQTKYVEGNVMLSFIVNKNGEITQIKPLTEFGYGMEKTAIELVMNYKNWGIITEKGKPINCFLTLPISFRLR